MKKYKLKKYNDLIEIYENGEFEEFKEAYKENREEALEYYNLLNEFVLKYFPEAKYPGIDFNGMSYEETCEFDQQDIRNVIPLLNIDNIIYSDKGDFEKDAKYPRLIELAAKFKGSKVDFKVKHYENYNFPNNSVNEFVNEYMTRNIKAASYITLMEDAVKYGEDELIDFIKKNPLNNAFTSEIKAKRLRDKLIYIRESSSMSLEQFAKYLGVTVYDLQKIEKGYIISNEFFDKYAALANISVEELLEFDEYILRYNHHAKLNKH